MARVLMIEDNIAILESLALDLQMRGYDVLTALDGKEALHLLEEGDDLPDIIVSDIAMPNMDGYQLLETIQQSPELQTIPFIYLTAFNSPGAMLAGKKLGADDYLVKPFKVEDLVVAIENKLRRAQQYRAGEARRMDKARRELLRLISHELRTPLTSIYGGADMLMKNIHNMPDDMSNQLLTMVRTGAKRMNRLIGQILMLVQIDSGTIAELVEKQMRPCDVNSLVQQAWKNVLKDTGIKPNEVAMTLNLSDQALWVDGVPEYLQSALGELLRNALVFDVPMTVATRVNDDGQVEVKIRDEGPGIPPEMVSQVWERFAQVDHAGIDRQGSGLGLPLVREILKQHRGHVTMTSDVDAGTTVTLQFPLARATPQLRAPE